MQRLVAPALVACLWAGVVGQTAMAEKPVVQKKPAVKSAAAQPQAAGTTEFVVGEPVRYRNLAIFPVLSCVPRNEDRYLTLDEGLKSGLVQVFEVGSQAAEPRDARRNRRAAQRTGNADPFGGGDAQGAEVNRLVLLNKSPKPLYLMPGEIIYGGQQNRTIAVEAIIAPGKKPVEIEVFCVEQGRWEANDAAETSRAVTQLQSAGAEQRDAKTREKLAEEAKHGKFVAHAGNLSTTGRAAVQEGKGQAEVWSKVSEANAASTVQTNSSDFVANYTDPAQVKKLQPYIDAMQASAANHKQVVGAIVSINGKIEAVDVFQSTPLFKKLWPKLLKSDALDALAVADQRDADKRATVDDARTFFQAAMQATVAKKTDSPGGLVVTKRDSERVMSFSAGMGGGGFGGADAVHSSAFKK